MHAFKIFSAALFVSLIAVSPAQAIETLVKGAPASLRPLRTPNTATTTTMMPDDPYTVRGIRVDQTGANPVKARELAIKALPKLALQKLVSENMTAEEAAAFKYPDDKTIGAMVQNFEVKGEQLSSTRYVANYTVRFSPAIGHYVTIKPKTATTVTTTKTVQVENPARNGEIEYQSTETTVKTADATPQNVAVVVAPALPQRQVLILPYYEDISGKTLLWEDNNSWRELWQSAAPRHNGNVDIIVPVGDLNDVATGSTDDVWSGDYKAIEKLGKIYQVEDIVLPVANKSGPYLTVDMYFFKNGTLAGRQVLQPFVSNQSEEEALRTGLQTVIAYLQQQKPVADVKKETVESIARDVTGTIETTTTVSTTAVAADAGPADIDVVMSFSQFSAWTDFQRRLASMSPGVVMDIKSLSRDNARFSLKYSGNIAALQGALQQKGVLLESPAVTVDTTQLGGSSARPVYSVQLLK